MSGESIEVFLSGARLYGDDFDEDQIAAWYADEAEAYADLGAAKRPETYSYSELNDWHGFRHLPHRFDHALGFGAAWGLEFVSIADRIDSLTIVDSSVQTRSERIGHLQPTYVVPVPGGTLPFENASFDLISILGVLHHVPNVTSTLHELSRCLAPGGYAVLREPIISMGDWRHSRGPGVTARERGIPLHILRRTIVDAGFGIVRESTCMFPLTGRLASKFRKSAYNSRPMVVLDDVVCSALARRGVRYHATSRLQKVRPASAFFVLRK